MTLSRREFARLSALGLAAQVAAPAFASVVSSGGPSMVSPVSPALSGAAPAQDRSIGYCIIGLGVIAGHFMAGIKNSSHCRVAGLVSGHRDKAERIAAQYGVPSGSIYDYGNMDEIAKNREIDAVYVALPNSMHAEYTIRSAKAGKHVLCEKPMCTTVSEAESMIAACKTAKVKLMIAYRCQYEPLHLKAMSIIREGRLGTVQSMSSDFGFSGHAGEWRLDKKLAGGGSLFDVGIYSLNASRYLSGEEPSRFSAITSNVDKMDVRFQQVEENVSWMTTFPSGFVASGHCTYGGQMGGFFRIYGSKGYLEMSPAFNYDGTHLRGRYAGSEPGEPVVTIDEGNPEQDPAQFQREAEHMAECIIKDQTPHTPGEEGLRDMRYIHEIYGVAGVVL
jgi:predicted dehydrogenase